ncbi:hypothetical protein BN128_3993 [Cronobacter sakazakii 696]|nr:hypothetical protein BN128_3993 [Cronobacter sakazakii 696]
MAQRVGEVGRDAERPAQANHVDILGLSQQLHRFFQLFRRHLHRQLLQRLGINHRKHAENFARRFRRAGFFAGGLAEQSRAFGIVGGLFHQMLSEHLLHFIKAAEAKRIGETDKRRRRHIRLPGDRGDGIERDAVAVIENVARHLFKPFAEVVIPATNFILKDGELGRIICHVSCLIKGGKEGKLVSVYQMKRIFHFPG